MSQRKDTPRMEKSWLDSRREAEAVKADRKSAFAITVRKYIVVLYLSQQKIIFHA